MTDDIAARFAWGSDRLRAWASQTFASAAPPDRAAAERAYAELRDPAHPAAWPALAAFEERFGGIVPARGLQFASAAWLHDVPRTGGLAIVRANRRLETSDSETDLLITPDVDGIWLAQIWMFDLDYGDWLDETGAVFRVNQLSDRVYPVAVDPEHFFEKAALGAEVIAQRGHATGDFFLELDGEHADAIARAAAVPPVSEASDAVSRYFWDGELVVRQRPKFGDPLSRATQLACGDHARLAAVARLAWDLARPPVLRAIGFSEIHASRFAAELRGAHPDIEVRIVTTCP